MHSQTIRLDAWAIVHEELVEFQQLRIGSLITTVGRHPDFGSLVAVEGDVVSTDGVVIHSERLFVPAPRSANVIPIRPAQIESRLL